MPWGTPAPTRVPGIYSVELPDPRGTAPIAMSAVRAWIRRVPAITVDGLPATGATLAARLEAFWVPAAKVLYIGQASGPCKAGSRPTTAHP